MAIPGGPGARPPATMERVPMSSKQERLQSRLKELVAGAGVLGAALVSRDGIRMMDHWKREMWNKETFSAMSATLMGAAEVALSELGGVRTQRVIAETNKMKLVVVGATDELVLVALGEADLPLERLLPQVEAAANDVTKIVLGD